MRWMCYRMAGFALAVLPFLAAAAPAPADVYERTVALTGGKLRVADLSAAVCREMHLPAFEIGSGDVDMRGESGSRFLEALNRSLGDGCRVSVSDDSLVLRLDPAN